MDKSSSSSEELAAPDDAEKADETTAATSTTAASLEAAPQDAVVTTSESSSPTVANRETDRRLTQTLNESTDRQLGMRSVETSASHACKATMQPTWKEEGHVEGAAHSSCSAEALGTNGCTTPSQLQQVTDMAIVSEGMAHASLTSSSNADDRRPEGAVIEQAASGSASVGETEGAVASVAVVPVEAPAKPKANEAGKPRKKKRSPPPLQPGQSSGRWTHAEHEAFLEGLKVFGREWKKVAVRIPTRTSAQVRSHAQKYFSKLARDEQLMNQESQAFEAAAAAAAAAAGSSASTGSSVTSAAADAMAAAQSHPPAIQRGVERILANPEQAQRDVEDTLRALRERYQQLQQQLQQHQEQEHRPGRGVHRIEEEKEEENNNEEPLETNNPNDQRANGKRRRGEANGDDGSMSSSTHSSLRNEELIALSVLGAALPNGGAVGPQPQQQQQPAQAPGHARQRSSSSLESNSSATSNTSKSGKRKREDAA